MKIIDSGKIVKEKFPEIKIINFPDKSFDFSDLSGVHIWKINISDLEEDMNYFESFLSFDEKKKALRFKFAADRKRCVVSRACLRILCGKYLSIPGRLLEIQCSSKGKPGIFGVDFSFNVSHSKDMVMIGFSKLKNLGVDVEYNRDMNDFMSIARNYFHSSEFQVLESAPKAVKKSLFLRYWTVKESYVKALGEGLGKSVNSFYVMGNLFEGSMFQIVDPAETNENFFVHSFKPGINYFASVCFSLI